MGLTLEQPTQDPLPAEGGFSLPREALDDWRAAADTVDIRRRLLRAGFESSALLETRDEYDPATGAIVFHQLVGFVHEGRRHAAWWTEPSMTSSGEAAFNLVRIPGYLEDIETEIGFQHHRGLARLFPEARTFTIANDGLGRFCNDFAVVPDYLQHMGHERGEIIEAIFGEEPVLVEDTSMGMPIANYMEVQSLRDGGRLNITSNVHFVPATVDRIPEHRGAIFKSLTHLGRTIRFMAGLANDAVSETALRTRRAEVSANIGRLATTLWYTQANLPLLNAQRAEIFRGLPLDEVEEVAAAYPARVILGAKDPFTPFARPVWQRLQQAYPSQVSVTEIESHGHTMTFKPERAAPKIAKSIREVLAADLKQAETGISA